MTFSLADCVLQSSTTTGTGPLTLDGQPPTGMQSFVAAFGDGGETAYVVVDATGQREITIGTVTAGPPDTISRAVTPIASSNNGARVDFAAGVKTVFCAPIAELLPYFAAVPTYADHQIMQREDGAWKPIPFLVPDFIKGLELSAAGSTGTFGIAPGRATDSNGYRVMSIASAWTKTTDPWAPGTGHGALDAGAIAANTWYHAYGILRPDTNVTDFMVSLNPASPALPENYTLYRNIMRMKTDASKKWIRFTQDADEVRWYSTVRDYNNVTGSGAAANLTLSVPTGVKVQAQVQFWMSYLGPGGGSGVIYSPGQSPTGQLGLHVEADSTWAALDCKKWTNTSAQISAFVADTAAFYVNTIGWIDPRGRW